MNVAHNSTLNQSQAPAIPGYAVEDIRDMNSGELVALQSVLDEIPEGYAPDTVAAMKEAVEVELLNREADLALDRQYC